MLKRKLCFSVKFSSARYQMKITEIKLAAKVELRLSIQNTVSKFEALFPSRG